MSTAFRILVFVLVAILTASHGRAQTGEVSPQQELTPAQQKAADLRLPELDRSALLPEKREPTQVPESERNPFGMLALPPPEEEQEVATVEAETEEMKLRRILGTMRVSGVAGGPGHYRLLLGSIQLRKGDLLPKLFADQAEVLRVEEINDRQAILAFVERKQDLPPRTIGLSFDLQPRVRSMLPGEVFTKLVPFDPKGAPTLKPLELEAAKRLVEASEKQGAESLVERSRTFMSDSYFRPNAPESPPAE